MVIALMYLGSQFHSAGSGTLKAMLLTTVDLVNGNIDQVVGDWLSVVHDRADTAEQVPGGRPGQCHTWH